MATTGIPHGHYVDLVLSEKVVKVGDAKKELSETLKVNPDHIHIVYKDHHDMQDNDVIFHQGKLHFVHISREKLYGTQKHTDKTFFFVVTTAPHGVDENGKVNEIKVYSNTKDINFPDLSFKTIRLSCETHRYDSNSNFAGFILYGWDSNPPNGPVKTKWELGGKRCQGAYMVIQSTSSKDVKHQIDAGADGKVHGAVYWNVFGEEDPHRAEGEGFSVDVLKDSKINNPWNSGVFNAHPDKYHVGKREISTLGRVLVNHIIQTWEKNSTTAIGRTYSVADILSEEFNKQDQ